MWVKFSIFLPDILKKNLWPWSSLPHANIKEANLVKNCVDRDQVKKSYVEKATPKPII